jgi:hypothetical protein
VIRTATISEDGKYRYSLGRQWSSNGVTAVFVMLNPSTADHEVDDPTIRRCIGFAKREGCGSLYVVNLFAFRATNPKELPLSAAEATGPDNSNAIWTALKRASIAVAAWGTGAANRQHLDVRRLADGITPLECLGTTKDGHPRHPLYVKADASFVPFTP